MARSRVDTAWIEAAAHKAARRIAADPAARCMTADAALVYLGLAMVDDLRRRARAARAPKAPVQVSIQTDDRLLIARPDEVIAIVGAALSTGWQPPEGFPHTRAALAAELVGTFGALAVERSIP